MSKRDKYSRSGAVEGEKKEMDYYKKFERSKMVPIYFKEHLEEVICRVNEEMNSGEKAAFVFLTDMHLYENTMSNIPLIREIGRNTPVKKVFCGGDIPWAFGTKEECLTVCYISLELLNKVKENMSLYIVRGNHDITIRESRQSETGYTMPYDGTRELIMPYQSDGIRGPENTMYFYMDDVEEKVRYIVVDTCAKHNTPEDCYWGVPYGFDEDQIQWLAGDALRPKDDAVWSIVVLGHVPCVPSLPSYSDKLKPLADMLKDFKNRRKGKYGDFSDTKAEFVAYICGHNHQDCSCIEDNTLFISTGSSARLYDDCWDRAEGTVLEELFDIYIVDKQNKRLKTVRVGAGESREFF